MLANVSNNEVVFSFAPLIQVVLALFQPQQKSCRTHSVPTRKCLCKPWGCAYPPQPEPVGLLSKCVHASRGIEVRLKILYKVPFGVSRNTVLYHVGPGPESRDGDIKIHGLSFMHAQHRTRVRVKIELIKPSLFTRGKKMFRNLRKEC